MQIEANLVREKIRMGQIMIKVGILGIKLKFQEIIALTRGVKFNCTGGQNSEHILGFRLTE